MCLSKLLKAKPSIELLQTPSEDALQEIKSLNLKLLYPILLDSGQLYYYTKAEDWAKIFDYVYFKYPMPTYMAARMDCAVEPDLAYTMGLFFADGTCSSRNGKSSWSICNTNRDLLERCIPSLEMEYPMLTFKIEAYPSEAQGEVTDYGVRTASLHHLLVGIPHPQRKPHQKAKNSQYGKRKEFIEDWERKFYVRLDDRLYKKVPPSILESANASKKAFLKGVIAGDGDKTLPYITIYGEFGRIGLMKLMHDINWKMSGFRDKRKPDNFRLRYNRSTEDLAKQGGCDDFAIWMMGLIHAEFGLNYFGLVLGNSPGGYHAYNIFRTEAGLLQVEPQTGNMGELGEGDYQAEYILL